MGENDVFFAIKVGKLLLVSSLTYFLASQRSGSVAVVDFNRFLASIEDRCGVISGDFS